MAQVVLELFAKGLARIDLYVLLPTFLILACLILLTVGFLNLRGYLAEGQARIALLQDMLLVRHFISQLNQRHQRNVVINGEAMSSLVSYPWPGNIRQLYNVCERIVLLARSDLIDEAMVDFDFQIPVAELVPDVRDGS